MIRIVSIGWGTTIQDLGRRGVAALGVPAAGAVDRAGHDRANRLVGNPSTAATIETLGGLVVEALVPIVAATSPDGQRHTLVAGQRLRVEAPGDRNWAYLAVRGGVAVEPVLGSRSQDTLAGVGPPPLVEGDELPLGPDPGTMMSTDLAPVVRRDAPVRIWPGPRAAWLEGGLHDLVTRSWVVGEEISRVGIRLRTDHAPLVVADERRATMASEGLVIGAIQIPPSGGPIVMLADHPTTGGYPVVAVIDPEDLDRVASTRPGLPLRFVLA